MLRKTSLLASALAVAALAPAAAHAAGAKLGGQPTMHATDAHYATLEFGADKLPRTRAAPSTPASSSRAASASPA